MMSVRFPLPSLYSNVTVRVFPETLLSVSDVMCEPVQPTEMLRPAWSVIDVRSDPVYEYVGVYPLRMTSEVTSPEELKWKVSRPSRTNVQLPVEESYVRVAMMHGWS